MITISVHVIHDHDESKFHIGILQSLKNVTRVERVSQESGYFAFNGNRTISKRRTVLRCFHVMRLRENKITRPHCPYPVPSTLYINSPIPWRYSTCGKHSDVRLGFCVPSNRLNPPPMRFPLRRTVAPLYAEFHTSLESTFP